MYLCMLAWIMDMFLLFNSIVYMLSCVIVHVLARALIYLLVWWHGNTHTHRHTHSTQEVKPEWKSRRKGRKTEIERLNMCDEWVKRSKLFLPPTNVSTERTKERTNDRPNDWVSVWANEQKRAKAISSICILSAVPEHCIFLCRFFSIELLSLDRLHLRVFG